MRKVVRLGLAFAVSFSLVASIAPASASASVRGAVSASNTPPAPPSSEDVWDQDKPLVYIAEDFDSASEPVGPDPDNEKWGNPRGTSGVGGGADGDVNTMIPTCRAVVTETPYWDPEANGGDGAIIGGKWSTQCVSNAGGIVYRKFANRGYNGEAGARAAYDHSRLPYTYSLKVEGASVTLACNKILYEIDPETQEMTVPKIQPNTCTWAVPEWTQTFRVPSSQMLTYYNTAPFQNCSGTKAYNVLSESGGTYRAPYIGYAAEWEINTGYQFSGAGMYIRSHTCLLPARPQYEREACFVELGASVEMYIPDPQFAGPQPHPGLTIDDSNAAARKWIVEASRQATDYKKHRPLTGDGDPYDAAEECDRQSSLYWDYEVAGLVWADEEGSMQSYRDLYWKFGIYDTQLYAPYDIVYRVSFLPDAFGSVPPPYIVWSASRLYDPTDDESVKNLTARWDKPTRQGYRGWNWFWRSELHYYCVPVGSPELGWARKVWQEQSNRDIIDFWYPNVPVPENLSYTPNDCAPPPQWDDPNRSVSEADSVWFCDNSEILTWGPNSDPARNVNLNGRQDIQSQADNLGRKLFWNEPVVTPLNGNNNNIRNVRDKTMFFKARDDSSPRLKGSDPMSRMKIDDQPFKFTPELGSVLEGWGDPNRMLLTQFREASRNGEDFSVVPQYDFFMDIRIKDVLITEVSTTGDVVYTDGSQWLNDWHFSCEGDQMDIEVLRVGGLPQANSD